LAEASEFEEFAGFKENGLIFKSMVTEVLNPDPDECVWWVRGVQGEFPFFEVYGCHGTHTHNDVDDNNNDFDNIDDNDKRLGLVDKVATP
jgi:hypothetical protein